ncbi:peptide deformylase [Eubacteriales bacterium OttesenSCG-928-K08]|nr:peptide deformylase [Eubacteriales bacterium OttesenSCG-928-K08]
MVREILLLGDPRLYEICPEVLPEEAPNLTDAVCDLHDTLMQFRATYGAGRAIAAPQIGIQKRLLYMCIDKPFVFINPVLTFPDDEMMEVMDDCMSFPTLYVKVLRHKRMRIDYRDMEWQECFLELEGNLSELLQHEADHLDGVLATMRAIDNRSYFLKGTFDKK